MPRGAAAVADCAVVGGGVAGLSAALALARRGLKVTLLAPPPRAGAASAAGAGVLSPLPPWEYAKPVRQLAAAGARQFPAWLETMELTPPPPCGLLVLPPFSKQKARAEKMRGESPRHFVDAREIKKIFPQLKLNVESLKNGGVWMPAVRRVRPVEVLAALRRAAKKAGVRFVPREARGFVVNNGRAAAAKTAAGEVPAAAFVLAAGAWSARLCPPPRPPVYPVRGFAATFAAREKTPVFLQNGVYGGGDGARILLGGGLQLAGFSARGARRAAAVLRARAQAAWPELRTRRLLKCWAGLRPGCAGNIPVIAPHPAAENLFLHTGHHRYGFTMAPAAANLLAKMVMGGAPPAAFTFAARRAPPLEKECGAFNV